MKIFQFEEALAIAQNASSKQHLLLGNGFSQACRKDIFSYGSLFERADFTPLSPYVKGAFKRLDTTDFEVVIKILRDASVLLSHYKSKDKELMKMLSADAEGLKRLLVETIAQNHPALPSDISDAQYLACRGFLSGFTNIYTLNYDLLLYWALMHSDKTNPDNPGIRCNDGFVQGDDPDSAYVVWDPSIHDQNIYYLHGALHVFEADTEIRKFTWIRTQIRLTEQINSALGEGMFPLIVAEGTSKQKERRIIRSGFFLRGLRSLPEIGGSLFVYGLSLSENDEHVLKQIQKNGKLKQVWVSIYGDPATPLNRRIIEKAGSLNNVRAGKGKKEVALYDAESARVWG